MVLTNSIFQGVPKKEYKQSKKSNRLKLLIALNKLKSIIISKKLKEQIYMNYHFDNNLFLYEGQYLIYQTIKNFKDEDILKMFKEVNSIISNLI